MAVSQILTGILLPVGIWKPLLHEFEGTEAVRSLEELHRINYFSPNLPLAVSIIFRQHKAPEENDANSHLLGSNILFF